MLHVGWQQVRAPTCSDNDGTREDMPARCRTAGAADISTVSLCRRTFQDKGLQEEAMLLTPEYAST